MEMVAPLSIFSETLAGGLGRLDLSCCAFIEVDNIKLQANTASEMEYFMVIIFVIER